MVPKSQNMSSLSKFKWPNWRYNKNHYSTNCRSSRKCKMSLFVCFNWWGVRYQQIHTEFGKFIDSLNTSNFDEIVDNVRSYTDLIQVSDWYHLLKDLRKRFSSNNISIYPNANFNAKQINKILNLDEIVITASGTVSMRDDLALNLFNSENLELLACHEEFCAFAFLFPFFVEYQKIDCG